ncbi:Ig-specific serine endopeptidase MIP [Mycoplasma sp. E35C]|uniref:Ig-specific serine endopeptidase MIP n=1 Tax=Mycoplasma sp. E35C TaxID=2801918 RepID=UPI001CA3D876|nr:DUF31 family protein [Mycoplasma sp. E35C]QZX49118.1 DUF31 family protein [Mycoplasma sp. E35C]
MKKLVKYFSLFMGCAFIVSSCATTPSKGSTDPKNPPPGGQKENGGDDSLWKIGEDIDNKEFVAPKVQWTNKVENGVRVVSDQYDNYSAQTGYINLYNFKNRNTQKPSFWLKDRASKSHVSPYDLTQEQLDAINQKAKAIDQPYYQDAYAYAIGLPGVDKTSKTLNESFEAIDDTSSIVNVPAFNKDGDDLQESDRGLSWMIPNEKYQDLSKITYSIRITNANTSEQVKQNNSSESKEDAPNVGNFSGTAFLLDYDLPTDNSKYPTTWYLASNFHVLQHLQLKNDSEAIIRNNKVATNKIELFQLDQSKVKIGEEIVPERSKGTEFKDPYLTVTEIDTNNVKTVFLGNDALTQSIDKFTNNQEYLQAKTLLDFGVIQVKFKDENEAKKVTNDYASWDENKKFKPAKFSYLNDEKYKSLPADDFYVYGLPPSKNDPGISAGFYGNIENLRSPWVNKPSDTNSKTEKGGDFSWSPSLRSFVNKPGISDIFLTIPRNGGNNSFYEINHQKFAHSGLGYVLDNYAVPPGGSGSPIINSNNEIVGVIFAGDSEVSSGIGLALHSEGFDYQKYYGSYNLPKYDLIYGSDGSQTKSYSLGLKAIHKGTNVNTWLFH